MDNATLGFNSAPQAVRRHIAIFGRRNVGKSSLMNMLAGQQVAIVSPQAGTTTDPVNRAIELHPLGPCLLIDTAGYDDDGEVGLLRNERTRQVLDQADMALLVLDRQTDLTLEKAWVEELKRREIPFVAVLNKNDLLPATAAETDMVKAALGVSPVVVSALNGQGKDALIQAMATLVGEDKPLSVTGTLAAAGDVVLLVMPQDAQAPRGRLILPQVQTIRDLLDKDCTAVCCTTDGLPRSLAALKAPPSLIITDSQVFPQVAAVKPRESRLTSFSVLMAALKGDLEVLSRGAAAIDRLTPHSRVLIAEACTHAPMSEDIGREKLPRIIRERVGQGVSFDVKAGKDYPADLTPYDLIIHCGACMFNRRMMLSRIARAQEQGVPITNYGLALAHLHGVAL
ncbi:MAG: [FeFe] hydrogenase H-cluster maturation GTPase HydF [Muribaculaceae bacterium]|nr:[FeFe] hydrogenase H-cluster maturation GTPase HydF [Muribaculaceae bacterium]